MTSMIKSLAHVCVYSSDLARTEAFYCGALGLSIQFRFIREGKLFGFYLKISDSQFIEVFYRENSASPEIPQIGHICLETDDILHVRKVLTEHQIETTEPKLGADHSWQMWCSDPHGTSIEFHQYTNESTQKTGEDCIVDWC
jgi:glyoxylase I family protein